MRKVSYTQMRSELSDILDAIRNGETVVVTQRGRPDTVLNGSLHFEHLHPSRYPSSRDQMFEVHKLDESTSITFAAAGDKNIQVFPLESIKVSFKEALNKTQQKHAKIIKALEDK